MFKDQIREALQAKFAGQLKKVSAKVLEQIVDHLSTKVTDEAQIQDTIDGLDEMAIPFSKYVELLEGEADRRVRQAKDNLKKDFEFVPKKPADQNDPKPEPGQQQQSQQQQPDLAAMIREALQPLTQQIESINQMSQRQKLRETFKAKGIPESWANDMNIAEGTSHDDIVTQAEQKWNEAKQIAINTAVDSGQVLRGVQEKPGSILEKIKEFGKDAGMKDSGYNIIKDI